ncbi:MAG: hypothetical protein KGM47_00475 [Acidobacteriota bacterium]|nr:hypothetical protein [Acidobacteriota bacterium]
MNWLEDELRARLRREEPPRGFAERVLHRLEVSPSRLQAPARRRGRLLTGKRRLGWLVAAACLVFMIAFAQHRNDERKRAQADFASRQAVIGLRIASAEIKSALQQARQVTGQASPENQ